MIVISNKYLANIVRFHRKKSKLTQIELADMAGIGKATLFDIEKGKTTIQFDKILALLDVLNIKIELKSSLMEEYEKSKNPHS